MEQFKDKKRIEIEQQFLYILSKIVETFPQYTLSQHMAHIFRRKNGIDSVPYFWLDEFSLRKIESYYDELISELASYEPENED